MAYTKKKDDYTQEINQRIADAYFQINPGRVYQHPIDKYMIMGDRVEEVKSIVVHSFNMGDVEDPDLYAAQGLLEWEHSEQGQWIMKNAVTTPTWNRITDFASYGYKYTITAKLAGPALTEWMLRYAK